MTFTLHLLRDEEREMHDLYMKASGGGYGAYIRFGRLPANVQADLYDAKATGPLDPDLDDPEVQEMLVHVRPATAAPNDDGSKNWHFSC